MWFEIGARVLDAQDANSTLKCGIFVKHLDIMSLENVLKALELSINGRLSEIDEDILQDKEVRSVLTTCFAEREARPELTSLIRAPSLMYEYLNLDLEEREELEGFRQENPKYLTGEGRGIPFSREEKKNFKNFIIKYRLTQKLIRVFDFYLSNRNLGELFNLNYLINNEALKRQHGRVGIRIYSTSRYNLSNEGGFNKILEFATEIRQEIKQYTHHLELFKIDGPNLLLKVFEFFLKNRKQGEVFSTTIFRDKQFRANISSIERTIYMKAKKVFGSFENLLELASKINQKIREYSSFKELIKIEYPPQLLRIFDYYLRNRRGEDKFNSSYLQSNERLKKEFGNLPNNIYQNSKNNLKNEGGINYIVQLAAQQRPEILQYWRYQQKKSKE